MKTNPYLASNVKLNPVEAETQKELPVWERVFDHKKYMEHEGPLKLSTGLSFIDVEPFPRLKLMKLYYMTLDELRDLPDIFDFKLFTEERVKWHMEIVDSTLSIREIEKTVGSGMVEELIIDAHRELKLVKIMKQMKPWEQHNDAEDTQFKEDILNVNHKNIFGEVNENFQHDRQDRPERPKTAGVHSGSE